jgi:hypothetical protein
MTSSACASLKPWRSASEERIASRMKLTRSRQPSSSRTVAAIFDWKPWQLRQFSNRVFLPRASGSSTAPW